MTYRCIEISIEEKQTPPDQPVPMLDWVRIDRMIIDDSYQRELGRTNWTAIRKISGDFHWSRFSPVLLAPIDGGRFAIIDGQHRAHAAAICGFETVPAMIVQIPKEEQAKAFSWVNSAVTKITPHHIYKAALAAGETWATTARDAVEGAGCQLATSHPSSKDRKPRTVYCIGLIRDLVKKGLAADLKAGLRAIAEYDTTGRVPLYSDYILRPFVSAIGDVNRSRNLDLVEFLRQNEPFKLTNRVDVMLANGEITGSRPVAHRRAFAAKLGRFALDGKP